MHHELSLAEKIRLHLENNFDSEELRGVTKIVIGVGKLLMADKENIRRAFDMIKKDTGFAHVEIDFVMDRLRFCCRHCGIDFSSDDFETNCPECGGTVRVLSGDDIYITEIIRS